MKHNNGFTIIELLIVITMVGILIGISVPLYDSYMKEAKASQGMQVLSGYKTKIGRCYSVVGKIRRCDGSKNGIPKNFGRMDNEINGLGLIEVKNGVISASLEFKSLEDRNPNSYVINDEFIWIKLTPVINNNIINWSISCSDYGADRLISECERGL